jgi:septal ring factor EnvC (AmiA/AmiB activator)
MVGVLSFSQTVFKIIAAAAAIILPVFHPPPGFCLRSSDIGVINADRLNVRPEPGTDRAPFKTIKRGEAVRILKQIDDWLKIAHKGSVGYIRNQEQYVVIVKKTAESGRNKAGPNVEQLKAETEAIGRKIDEGRQELKDFSKKEGVLAANIDDIDMMLNNMRKRSAAIRSALAALEKNVGKTTARSRDLQKKIRSGQRYVSTRLVALYKLGWLGKMQFLASAESVYDFFYREAALRRLLTRDEKARADLIRNEAGLARVLAGLNEQKEAKRALEADLKKQIGRLSPERKKRSKLLAAIRSRKSLETAFIESLRKAADELNQKLSALDAGTDRPPNTDTIRFEKTFHSLKGLLHMPVRGKIVGYFGRYKSAEFNTLNYRSGIDIQAERGEPIHAVSSGAVLYASWFKGYGNMMIIDHGDNYHTIYAHMEELFKAKGDLVETGEVIATVGDTGSIIGPGLYFEVRHHGKPLDAVQWIKKG